MPNKVSSNVVFITLVCAICFIIAVLVGAIALGRDVSELTSTVFINLPAVIAALLAFAKGDMTGKTVDQVKEQTNGHSKQIDQNKADITDLKAAAGILPKIDPAATDKTLPEG